MIRNFALAAGLPASFLFALAAEKIPAPAAAGKADAVKAVADYFPYWTRPTGNKARVFLGWWWYLENAVPPFPGHEQPKKPVRGHEDESGPTVMARKVAVNAHRPFSYHDDSFACGTLDTGRNDDW